MSRATMARLFHTSTDAIDIVKWRDRYHDPEETIDSAEDAAEVMERMYHKAN